MLREFETVLKAVADPTRARILKILEHGELCVCQVVAVLGLGQSTVSRHLAVLRNAGLIEDRKEGRWAFYRLATDPRSRYASAMVELLKAWLNDDDSVMEDRRRAEVLRRIPVDRLCTTDPRRFFEPGHPGIQGDTVQAERREIGGEAHV